MAYYGLLWLIICYYYLILCSRTVWVNNLKQKTIIIILFYKDLNKTQKNNQEISFFQKKLFIPQSINNINTRKVYFNKKEKFY